MGELIFKKAGKKDAAVLAEFRYKMFGEIFPGDNLEKRKTEIIDECIRYYINNIDNKNHFSVIAYIESTPAGCGTILLHEIPPDPKRKINLSAYILNIYVDNKYRGMGIAKKIMEHLYEYARIKGVRRIGLHASRFGHNLYKKMGYKINESYLELEL